jgi:translation initiation factor 4E
VERFWAVYQHIIRPAELPIVSDCHLFKQSIMPVWEVPRSAIVETEAQDERNVKGGKWIVRLKKGLANRMWENLVRPIDVEILSLHPRRCWR